jgi:hypothetical protein
LSHLLRFLRSPRLALSVIGFLAVWTGVGAWAPWMQPQGPAAPAWAVAIGLGHPFTSWPFLVAVALLFASTLACTWGRRARTLAIGRGEFPPSATRLPPRSADARAFLAEQGFRGRGETLTRFGPALWGGWVLHVGLLVLIAAVLVQHALFDSGVFDLSEGEKASLAAHGTVFGREKGPLARQSLPEVDVALVRFDPFQKQAGYSSDRLSELEVTVPGEPLRVETVDRAAGIRAGDIEIFQAIPSGMAITIDISGMGMRSLRLQTEAPRRAVAAVTSPSGEPARFVLETERDIDGAAGTGKLLLWMESRGERRELAPGLGFPFGAGQARVVGIGRWGRFTYTRTPGLSGVFAGFIVILAGCTLLAFPAGVARIGRTGEGAAALVFTVRGGAAIATDWERAGPPA